MSRTTWSEERRVSTTAMFMCIDSSQPLGTSLSPPTPSSCSCPESAIERLSPPACVHLLPQTAPALPRPGPASRSAAHRSAGHRCCWWWWCWCRAAVRGQGTGSVGWQRSQVAGMLAQPYIPQSCKAVPGWRFGLSPASSAAARLRLSCHRRSLAGGLGRQQPA